MLLTTTTIKRNELKVTETTKENFKKALYVAKVLGEVTLIAVGILDGRKYKI